MRELNRALPRRSFLKLSAATAALTLGGCVDDIVKADPPAASDAAASGGEDAKLLTFFSQSFTRELDEAPEFMTALGQKKRYGEWNDYSAAYAEHSYQETAADL